MEVDEHQDQAIERHRRLLERIADPVAIEHWLARTEAALLSRPGEQALRTRRATLLRELGRIEEAHAVEEAPAGAARFVRVNDLLTPEEIVQLWQTVAPDGSPFEQARIGKEGGVTDLRVRYAALMCEPEPLREWFLRRLDDAIAREDVLMRLGIEPFEVGRRELQVTRHVHGGFYRMHRDASASEAATTGRALTYVYYFHRHPRPFSGGDLLMFDQDQAGHRDPSLAFTRLAPLHNSVVFFAPDRLHAVTNVGCASSDPLDGRWTVNGWFYRASGYPTST